MWGCAGLFQEYGGSLLGRWCSVDQGFLENGAELCMAVWRSWGVVYGCLEGRGGLCMAFWRVVGGCVWLFGGWWGVVYGCLEGGGG